MILVYWQSLMKIKNNFVKLEVLGQEIGKGYCYNFKNITKYHS